MPELPIDLLVELPGRSVDGLVSALEGAFHVDRDMILWYRAGGEASDRLWRDLLGVMEVQGSRLDLAFLREWADRIGVRALLTRALDEAGRGSL